MQTIIYRMDDNKVLLYSTGNYISNPVINHNGKEHTYIKNVCIYIYIYILYISESLCCTAEINTIL